MITKRFVIFALFAALPNLAGAHPQGDESLPPRGLERFGPFCSHPMRESLIHLPARPVDSNFYFGFSNAQTAYTFRTLRAQERTIFGRDRLRDFEVIREEMDNLGIDPKVVLEVGVGARRGIEGIQEYFPRALIQGIDKNPAFVEQAILEAGRPEPSVRIATANVLNFQMPYQVDLVTYVFSGFNELSPEGKVRFLNRAREHFLVPGGILAIDSMDFEGQGSGRLDLASLFPPGTVVFDDRVVSIPIKNIDAGTYYMVSHLPLKQEIYDAAERAGFKVVWLRSWIPDSSRAVRRYSLGLQSVGSNYVPRPLPPSPPRAMRSEEGPRFR